MIFDIIIAGAGPAGATLAVGLARRGRRVAVVEPVPRQAESQPSYDDRALALNAASLNILANLGLLDDAVEQTPIRHIRVSRAGGFGRVELDAERFDLDRFGSVVVARALGRRLLDALDSQDNIAMFCPAKLDSFEVSGNGIRAVLDNGEVLSARLLVGADGSRSAVRELAGIDARSHHYGQHALVFNVMPEIPQPFTAWERFSPTGPLALLPQPEGRAGVVWIDDKAAIDEVESLDDGALLTALRQRFGHRLGNFSRPGRRGRYPLTLRVAERHAGQRVVLAGNSATTVHPVSAQGFNLGLRDIAGLLDATEGQTDPGDAAVLDRYCELRREDQAATVRYTDGLARGFTNPSRLARAGTGLGLFMHALSPALQRRLVTAAMGFRAPVSDLARAPSP